MTESEREVLKRRIAQKLSDLYNEANRDYKKYVELVEEYERIHPKATEYIPRGKNQFWYGTEIKL